MGIFNSISNVAKYNKDLTRCEQENNDKKEQRKAYLQLHPATQDELELAKSRGKVVIDIINDMDQHSEDIAENVEEFVSQPMEAFGPFVGLALGSVISYFTLFKKMNSSFKNITNRKNPVVQEMRQFLSDNYTDIKNSVKFGFADDFASVLGDSHKIKKIAKKSTNPELKKAASELFKKVSKDYKNVKRFGAFGVALVGALGVAGFIGGVLGGTALQVKSSRIARWQSREKLKDAKYFVEYNDEQIAQAKEKLQNKKQKKFGLFNKKNKKDNTSLIKLLKDNKKYNEWKKNDKDDSKMVQGELSNEDLIQAKKDKEYIQRITREINNKAEDYSENMEVAAGVIIGGSPILGWLVSKPINWIAEKTGFVQKIFSKRYDKLLSAKSNETKEAVKSVIDNLNNSNKDAGLINNFKNLTGGLDGIGELFGPSGHAMAENGGNLVKNVCAKALDMTSVLSKIKGGRGFLLKALIIPATSIAGMVLGLKLQKSAARAGRYVAKREIEKDPANFIGLTDEELKEVSHVKGKKESLGKRFVNYIAFIPKTVVEFFQYKKYTKTEAKQNAKLLEELTKLDVTDKQLADAKNLQRKMFNTFEKVDEGSQQYSESMEAANTMLKPILQYGSMISLIGIPALALGIAAKRGKLNLVDITNSVSGFLGKHTKFLKGKTVSKYSDSVSKKISSVTKGVALNTDETKLNQLLSKITNNTKETTLQDVADILDNNTFREKWSKKLCKKFGKMAGAPDFVNEADIVSKLDDLKEIIEKSGLDKATKLQDCKLAGINERLGIIDDIFAADNLKKFLDDKKEGVFKEFSDDSKSVLKLVINSLKKELKNAKPDEWKQVISDVPFASDKIMPVLEKYGKDNLTSSKLLSILENFEKIMSNLPKEQADKIMNTAIVLIQEDPVKFAKAVSNKAQLIDMFRTKGVTIAMVTVPAAWTGFNFLMTYTLESVLASMEKRAGRLGVMKGLDELEDARYYANENADNQNAKELKIKPAQV